MTLKEAKEIIELFERYYDSCCTCHMGHPPCSYCTDRPSDELFVEACNIINDTIDLDEYVE